MLGSDPVYLGVLMSLDPQPPEPSNRATRDELIIAHQDYARSLARQIHKKLPRQIDFEEVAAYANVGLVEAAGNYDSEMGAAFKTFAYFRVRGAVFDGLRQMNGATKEVKVEAASAAGRDLIEMDVVNAEPTDDAERLAGRFSEAVTRTITVFLMSQMGEEDSTPVEPAHRHTPDKSAENREAMQRVTTAIRKLPENFAQLLDLHYCQHKNLVECAKVFGKDKATMTRWHRSAIQQIRDLLCVAKGSPGDGDDP